MGANAARARPQRCRGWPGDFRIRTTRGPGIAAGARGTCLGARGSGDCLGLAGRLMAHRWAVSRRLAGSHLTCPMAYQAGTTSLLVSVDGTTHSVEVLVSDRAGVPRVAASYSHDRREWRGQLDEHGGVSILAEDWLEARMLDRTMGMLTEIRQTHWRGTHPFGPSRIRVPRLCSKGTHRTYRKGHPSWNQARTDSPKPSSPRPRASPSPAGAALRLLLPGSRCTSGPRFSGTYRFSRLTGG